MKVKVVNKFVDKTTRKLRKDGEVFDCNENRFEQIEKVGHFVEKIDDKQVESKSAK